MKQMYVAREILKKPLFISIILSSLLTINAANANDCPTVVSGCSNTSEESSSNSCSDYFLPNACYTGEDSGDEGSPCNTYSASNGTYTYYGDEVSHSTYYCTDSCSYCSSDDVSDCSQSSTNDCKSCSYDQKYDYYGTTCSGSSGSCSNGGAYITCNGGSNSSFTTS